MPPTLYRDTNYSLTHLIEEIKHGEIALPDIQRPFVWSSAKVRDLFDSMYKGYPIGTLLFWETGADTSTRQVGGGEHDKVAKQLIVDGQQRLTSLFAVLTGQRVLTKSFENRQIQIAFRPSDETFEVADAAIRRDPEFIPDITELWKGRYKATVKQFLAKLAESRGEELHEDLEEELESRIDRVRDLRDFRFQVIQLNVNADEEQVADIFVRINSKGEQLNQADFILTLMSVHWEKGRRELEQFSRHAVDPSVSGPSPKNTFIDPSPDQLLRASVGLAFKRARLQHVYSILRGKDLNTGELSTSRRANQFERLRLSQDEVLDLTNWHEYLKCLTLAGFRTRRMITSDTALIYCYVIWLIGRREFGLSASTLQTVAARWFFMAQTTGRYTGSSETALDADLGRISALEPANPHAFCDELDRQIRANFTNDYWEVTLPTRLDTSSAKSPALCAYWAALNVLDAELLFSNLKMRDMLKPGENAPRSVERHHLFPKAHLNARGISDTRQVNAIANMAFLDWPDNSDIGSDNPMAYWPAMSSRLNFDQLQRQTEWHALPVGWEQLEYAEFLEKRRALMARVTRNGFERLWDSPTEDHSSSTLVDLLAAGESQTIEFKSTARFNLHTGQPDKRMEHVVAKTVCGFLNAEGGKLLVGVDDDASVIGLLDDMRTLGSKGNSDGYELFLRQLLDNTLSAPTAATVRVHFESHAGADVCVVTVSAAAKPVFAKAVEGGGPPSEFWVRIGNATKQLHGDDMVDYQTDHWG
ncbi:MAG: DUF262 domain-containing protein [Acidimicrobiaceae bacterium]|nr:DUF262 domain-containing protein [Acidimicrobiaceae bacterium]